MKNKDFIECIKLSLDSAYGYFQGTWYRAKDGVPTGGKLCVHVANISVYYKYKNVIFANRHISLTFLDRFVDDGVGGWLGGLKQFYEWLHGIMVELYDRYKLQITCKVVRCDKPLEFLDVLFWFENGILNTDIFLKPTDSQKYLNYASNHPVSTFRGTLYSQALRYRRIVISDELLGRRLDLLGQNFVKCGYPRQMVQEIMADVKNKQRSIEYKTNEDTLKVPVPYVTTFGPSSAAVKAFAHKVNDHLRVDPVFNDFNCKKIVVPVFRKARSLNNVLFKQKDICFKTETSDGKTVKCTNIVQRGRKCASCPMASHLSKFVINGVELYCEGGDCKSSIIIYLLTCKLCQINYFGKTVNQFRDRFNGHRSHLKNIRNAEEIDDENSLAAHAYFVHDLNTVNEFNDLYRFSVVKRLQNPDLLTRVEQSFINRYKTQHPLGLNMNDPIGIRMLF